MTGDVIHDLGLLAGVDLGHVRVTGQEPVMPSPFRIGTAAAASVGAATAVVAALNGERGRAEVDLRHAAVAFRSERHFRIGGEPIPLWAPISGDYACADGRVRIHANFDHHRDAAMAALALPPDATREQVGEACGGRTGKEIEEAVTRAGGCAAAMRSRTEWAGHPHGRAVAGRPVLTLDRLPGPPPGETGMRVVDLTRVIAGPVASRFLASHGADVMHVCGSGVPEVPGLVLETAAGKRSCLIDLPSGAELLRELIRGADVVIRGYRPGALDRLGFGTADLVALRPGIVVVDVSAYGPGPWLGRRGFDSLVQMVTGIVAESGPLPCQALDHATGYLAAFAAVAGLLRRRREGGSWHATLSLAATARWLDGLGRTPPGGEPEVDDLLETRDGYTFVRPPGLIAGRPPIWSPPPRPGEHAPAW
ncbi:carnitine dehydratase [Herbidospora galbida]|uniref:Carnitine dehydratase n=1 Tax=Herbidospora galbida TaxID=2575442 RepID=A0A4U3M151_9ACTN|nr:CoA transferase [Herbidospora galbida]TKK80867.1 carnitine dehydratase [Herbidospora galbida]